MEHIRYLRLAHHAPHRERERERERERVRELY